MQNEKRQMVRNDVLDEETKSRIDALLIKFMNDCAALEAAVDSIGEEEEAA